MGNDQDKELQQKVTAYRPSKNALDKVKHIPLLFAVGISGAGKDTALRTLLEHHPNDYSWLVTTTTRPRRENNGVMEEHGVEYYFIDKPSAERLLNEGAYVEANYYASNVYGATIAEIARGGQEHKILVSDIDVNGILNFVRLGMNVKPVFILPPSYEIWHERFHRRYGDALDQQDLRKRLTTALAELKDALDHDYYYLVINDTIEETVERIHTIAHGQEAERRSPQAIRLIEQLRADITRELADA